MSGEHPYPVLDLHTYLAPEWQARVGPNQPWRPWYQGPIEALVPQLLAAGVDRFACLPYAQRSGQAQSLNYWAANVQTAYAPRALGFGTFHPDDAAALPGLVDEAFGSLGLWGAKLHPGGGGFWLDDERLYPLYERAIDQGKLLLIHAGKRPEDSSYLGARAFARLMRRFPTLRVVVAHMGADEFDAFFDLCGAYDGVYLDTALVFHHLLGGPPPIERVVEHQDRVVFGTAFPNMPYRVETAVRTIRDLRLGRGLEEKILATNAARLLGLDPYAVPGGPTASPSAPDH